MPNPPLSMSQDVWKRLEQGPEEALSFVKANLSELRKTQPGRRAAFEVFWRLKDYEQIVQIGAKLVSDFPEDLRIATAVSQSFLREGQKNAATEIMADFKAFSSYQDHPAAVWALLNVVDLGQLDLGRDLYQLISSDRSVYANINDNVFKLLDYLFGQPQSLTSDAQTLSSDAEFLVLDLALGGGIGHGQMFAQFVLTGLAERLSLNSAQIDYHGGTGVFDNPVLSDVVRESVSPSLDILPWLWRTQKGLGDALPAFNEIVEKRLVDAFGENPEITAPVVMFPYTLPSDLLGFATWLSGCKLPENGIHLAIGLLFNDFMTDPQPQKEKAIEAFKAGVQKLLAHPKITLHVFSEVDEINGLVAEFGVPDDKIFLLPFLPSARFEGRVAPAKLSKDTPTVGTIGTCRPSRGHHHILSACEQLESQNTKILMQATPSSFDWFDRIAFQDGIKIGDQIAKLVTANRLQWIEEPLSQDDYDAALLSLDAVVLPYDPDFYKNTGSGVAFEAVAARRHLILSADCAFAGLLARVGYPHTLIHDLSGNGVANAINRALQNAAILDKALARWNNSDLLFSELERFVSTLNSQLIAARET